MGGVLDCHKKSLDIMQKCILKIMYGKKYTFPSREIYEISKVLDIRQIFASKIITSVQQKKIPLVLKEHNYSTRKENDKYERPKAEKRLGQRSCTYLASRLYPRIPSRIKQMKSIKKFKREIKNWLIAEDRSMIHRIINST